MTRLAINEVIESTTEPPVLSSPCRVLWIDRASDCIVLMALVDRPKQPFGMALSDVEQWLCAGITKTIPVQPPAYMLRTDITDSARAFRDKNWERIAPLLADDEIFGPDAMGPMVAARAAALSIPRKTLYRLW